MKKLFSPYWIIFSVSIPQIVLFSLYLATYRVIGSLLAEENLSYWLVYGSILGVIWLIFSTYAVYSIYCKHQIHPLYAFLVFLFYVPFLYAYMYDSHRIIPWSIPEWMLFQGDVITYMYTFLMPALFHALWMLVLYSVPRNKEHQALQNFFGALAIPLIWYLIFVIVFPLMQGGESGLFARHFTAVLFISSTIVFLFLIFRFLYILSSRYPRIWVDYEIFWRILITIIFPLVGLWLNNKSFDFAFGDFSDEIFYILAFINGVLLCLPSVQVVFPRYLIFIARSITFPYIIYFLLVFLPYLPLSIPAIIAFGTGFLILTPLAVMIIQSWILSEDYLFLKRFIGNFWLSASFVAALAVLPGIVLYSYQQDKNHLHLALNHVYEANYQPNAQKNIKLRRILRTLDNIKKAKTNGRNNFGFSLNYKPYLSNIYQSWVLENLTLSDAKIQTLERVFVGESNYQSPRSLFLPTPSDSVMIDSVYVDSKFDSLAQSWTSWVHLEIRNQTAAQQEYACRFDLPVGAWIGNYYLQIENKKEYGILAEKKAAVWVYEQIVGQRRDPGILYYLSGNRVQFRVFPFAPRGTRYTGIELIHKEPLHFEIGGQKIQLGQTLSKQTLQESIKADNIYYIPTALKNRLPLVKRKPYYHFIVDCSMHQKSSDQVILGKIQNLLEKKLIAASEAKISLVNHQYRAYNFADNWGRAYRRQRGQGGFFLEYALKSILLENYQQPDDKYPILVVISDALNQAVFTEGMGDFRMTYPELNNFYSLENQGVLREFSLFEELVIRDAPIVNQLAEPVVRAFPNARKPIAFLPNNLEPALVIENPNHLYKGQSLEGKSWENALILAGMSQCLVFNPYQSEERWLPTVKNSFRTKIMSPQTSYLSVENEAQKQALLEKQKQTLSAKKSLDAGEETRMSEPSLFWMIFLLLGVFLYRLFIRKNQKTFSA
ncbi:MAG: MSEP-CTERM sorting domain-containing protein [Microscillaceae bacterium]|nr:MSEP-CTERM sorting domain-containing protein [Microscillaceae bacterium]